MIKMLIVDDDENMITLVRRMLKKYDDIDIDQAIDGKEGLIKLNDNDYDIVVIDLMLPYVNGAELLSFIKNSNKNVLKVVCSAYTDLSSRFLRNVDAYIPKPIDYVAFKATIEKICNIRQHVAHYEGR